MNCIIVEDQAPAQRLLKKYIDDYGKFELLAVFSGAIEASQFLKENSVDLIFLDIHLPKISGLDFLKSLSDQPSVILTTAFSDYAMESYELNVADYLVKPFPYERFVLAVKKVEDDISSLDYSHSKSVEFFIKSGHDYIKLNTNDLCYVKSDMNYTELHLLNKKYLSQETLQYWQDKFEPWNFVRNHKSYLVNVNKIEKVSGNTVYLTNGVSIPVGRAYRGEFKEVIGKLGKSTDG